ncbi:hypothetical protein [uncultured Polaribacter sp.]|uniref:hypothetical protein n=1 Tax=uncultured Polaribacter sp. TaxID=174711 RepID=UPI00262FBA38|nr:hypothetical protein [uncultured Polaribacter sp.]
MRKIAIICSLFSFCFLSLQCSKEDPVNQPPTAVQLLFPSENLLCIDTTITFDWSDATDPENDDLEYTIIIAKDRQLTDIVENRTVTKSQLSIILEKSMAYYWKVNALDVNNNQGVASSIFAFYTKGDAITNYAPFMATIISPENTTSVSAGNLDLIWKGEDVNASDTLTYELYFGENTTLNLVDDALSVETYTVAVASGKTYSWKVNVIDDAGAKSIGQTFSFTVN